MSFPGRQIVRRALGRMAWRGARCCFVLSTGRTGSHTLTTLLNLSPQVRAFHEPAPQLLAESLDAFYSVEHDPERFKKIFASAKSADIGIARVRRQLYAETSNRLTFFAPVIAELLPRARFIHLHRNPAEVVRSGMRRGWYCNHPWDPYRVAPAPGDPAFDQWSDWDCFAKNCWYWSAINEFAMRFIEFVAPDRCLTMSFDALMDLDYGAWRMIYRFLDVEPPHLYAVREVLELRENQQNTGDFAPPSEWDEGMWNVMRQIVGPTAEKLGYANAIALEGAFSKRAS